MAWLSRPFVVAVAAATVLTTGIATADPGPRDVARCLVRHDMTNAAALAAARPGSAADDGAANALAARERSCPGAIAALADPGRRLLIGGAIAESLRARDNRGLYGQRVSGTDTRYLDAADYSDRALRHAREWPANVATISCAVGRDLRSADALLRTKPGSARELAAIQALAPAIERCVGRGERMAFDRATVRAIVARDFYTSGFTANVAAR